MKMTRMYFKVIGIWVKMLLQECQMDIMHLECFIYKQEAGIIKNETIKVLVPL